MNRQDWINLLKTSVSDFNRYRRDYPQESPDLSGANLWEVKGLSPQGIFECYIENLRQSISFG